ncbi:endonuclease/exonuclease/phosphatase family protein [Alkalilimnicola sp. S0819]|uniref:endonuclease/exonuclease/phosphatase family protein n=1 Tax=Alkalilimnicola sp. S0819 TaxID=2613922 RepID=UPI0012620D28|nr:endonuclease/exonuclease/phosphatase family protein [Alkalilimnicola sp. S0819]KAB7624296.1 hypothetical protein F3N43_05670 [Alkalilimnicola sp. S0819]MPQ16120.1 hypothetical protein [Alkalilimnicola sp. S0819]
MSERLRIAVCNLQGGVGTTRGWWHYLSTGWRYWLPHGNGMVLEAARFLREERVDLALCSEVENASRRCCRVDQARLLADAAGLRHVLFFETFRLGERIRQGNAVLARYPLARMGNHRLPGRGQPRYLSEASLALGRGALRCYVTHLSLEQKFRLRQIRQLEAFLGESDEPRVLGGDFNVSHRAELELLRDSPLTQAISPATFPSWKPRRHLEHLFASRHLHIERVRVFERFRFSDHLPLLVDVALEDV